MWWYFVKKIIGDAIEDFLSRIGLSKKQIAARKYIKDTKDQMETEAYKKSVELTTEIFGDNEADKVKRKGQRLSVRKRLLLDRFNNRK